MIVRAWSETCVNLQVFTDGENDRSNVIERSAPMLPAPLGAETVPACIWRTSVHLWSRDVGPETQPAGTWRWPERT